MSWDLSFINESDFETHVKQTIIKYYERLNSYDLKKFNDNVIDPVKMLFDQSVNHIDWAVAVDDEIVRQRDKSNANEIGYFHQKIFKYFDNCEVPRKGWDIIYRPPGGYVLDNGDTTHTIYVELKNKHNTMNSNTAARIYGKMRDQVADEDSCACFLVEVVAKRSQNCKWETTYNRKKVSHNRIRRVSIDKFYEIVTGESDAFYKVCMALPDMISKVLRNYDSTMVPHDTVTDELVAISNGFQDVPEESRFLLAVYMLGFRSYNGFNARAKKNDFLP